MTVPCLLMLNCVFCVEEVMLAEENKNSGTSALEGKTSNALKFCLPFLLHAWSWRLRHFSCDGEAPVGSAAQGRGEGRCIGTITPERAWMLCLIPHKGKLWTSIPWVSLSCYQT